MCITNFHIEKLLNRKNQLECKISFRRGSQQRHPSSPKNPKFRDRTRRIKSKGESKKIRPCPPTSSAKHARSPSETYGQRKRNLHHRPDQTFNRSRQLRHRGSSENPSRAHLVVLFLTESLFLGSTQKALTTSSLTASDQRDHIRHHLQNRASIGDADSDTGAGV